MSAADVFVACIYLILTCVSPHVLWNIYLKNSVVIIALTLEQSFTMV